MKYEQYITESTTTNRFNKLIKKYKTDMKKFKDNSIRQAEFFINQVKNPEELAEMMNILEIDENDEVQDDIAYLISQRIKKLEG